MLRSFAKRILPRSIKNLVIRYISWRRFGHEARRIGELKGTRIGPAFPPWDHKIFSQNGEDGIIDRITQELKIKGSSFVEFGFSPYESNLLFYAAQTGVKGLFIDGSSDYCDIAKALFPSRGINAKAVCSWIDRDNINDLISKNIGSDVGILSIDLDGNDYWVWQSITAINPILVIVEYNASFGPTRSVSTPYAPDFDRFRHHSSASCHGMSLRAAVSLAEIKGYSLVCTDLAGLNAFFVRNDRLTTTVHAVSAEEAFKPHKYRTNENSPQDLQEKIAFQGSVVDVP
jgi:hypothetical protein